MAADASASRPRILYSDAGPEPPYPLCMEGVVIAGFGRGSKELGIPTANLPVDAGATPWIASAKSGVYFGYAAVALPAGHPDRPASPRAAAAVREEDESSPSGRVSPTVAPPSPPPPPPPGTAWQIYPMVMSIGYNPFYKNAVRSAEVHVLHAFAADFYGAPLRLLLLGFVRDERDYASLDALVRDINVDCDVARQSLARPAWSPREGAVGGAPGVVGTFDGSWLVRD
ncbi:riboflavin kinase [Durotheca rogersii]|uniref:riboflavin kinase n=1 Tax=Durotheca rogersii TaxID=419775 RepID=UPI00221F9328|nr:riboflavin kinase [Durotheca rogersii]KAI5865949.1 riboflavin kinase [Durotheca rogersii]